MLIDGIKIGSATTGAPALQHIPLDQIQRIEVVRGPRSSLYGSDAIGGVIQIFTKKAVRGITANARVSAGTHNTSELSAGVNVGGEAGALSVNVSHFKTDGVNALDQGSNVDKDGYERKAATINFNKSLSDKTAVDLTFQHIDGHNQYDSRAAPFDDYNDDVQQTFGARINSDINDSLTFSAGVSRHQDKSISYGAFSPAGGEIETLRHNADIKLDSYLNDDHVITGGIDFQQDEVFKYGGNYDVTRRDNIAGFGQWQANYGKLGALAGLRHDDNEAYGAHTTGNLNLGYQLIEGHRLLGSYGTGFKAPTFNQLYWPGFANPNLKPEESESFELGYEGQEGRTGYAVRAFMTTIDNLISSQPTNEQARIKGIEFELSTELAEWELRSSASLLQARDREDGLRLQDRAERVFQLDARRQFGSLLFSAAVLAQGDRFTDAGNTIRLPGYGIANIKVNYSLDKHWAIEGKVNNLLDKEYSTNSDFSGNLYSSLDRTLMLSLSYNR